LRYYEKIGLLTGVSRNAQGHRQYADKDVDWVQFILRLKDTGMPLQEIQRYAQLRAQGAETYEKRQAMLEKHRAVLNEKLQTQQQHLSVLDAKIAFYEKHKTSLDFV
jgi:DNA-binding transcriptional MerR regulator